MGDLIGSFVEYVVGAMLKVIMGIVFLLVGGFLIGLKLSLIAQLMIGCAGVVFLLFIAGRDARDSMMQALIIWVIVVYAVGLLVGDLYYYISFYKGVTTFSDFFGWFIKP